MKKRIALACVTATLVCSSVFAHNLKGNKVYTFECPTPQMIIENISWHTGEPVIEFQHSGAAVNYDWMPPELQLIARISSSTSLINVSSYKAVVLGQEARCEYQTDLGEIVLHLTPPQYYKNAQADVGGDVHRIQITQ